MEVKIHETWKEMLRQEFEKPYFHQLVEFVKEEYQSHTVYPPGSQIFNAFEHCPFPETKVVIIGQDPYHGKGQAHGLCFSVNRGVTIPPSLVNIYKEIRSDLNIETPDHGDLTRWSDQGVLLLNATLTVRASSPGSHQNRGWETFTDSVISVLSSKKKNLVFLLWGAYAQKKGEIIDRENHHVLTSPHPSPFSANRGFLGNRHFSKTNDYLLKNGLTPIKW